MSQGIRFTDGPNAFPTMELSGVTYTIVGTPKASVGSNLGPSRTVKTAAATLTAADSGALCLFNTAAGILYTLPAAQKGLWFEFQVTVTATSLVHRVACATGDFLIGHFVQSTDGTYTSALRAADGSTILAWEGNGSTKGGIVGDWLKVTAISDTQWAVIGMGSATGAEATPFVTS